MAHKLTLQQRAQIASRYKVWQSPIQVQRWWRSEYGKNKTIDAKTIKSCHHKLMTTGSVGDLSRSGRPASNSCEERIQRVSDAFVEDGSKSSG